MRFQQKYEEEQDMRIKKSLECMELMKQRDDQYEQTMSLREKLADTELRLKAASGTSIVLLERGGRRSGEREVQIQIQIQRVRERDTERERERQTDRESKR